MRAEPLWLPWWSFSENRNSTSQYLKTGDRHKTACPPLFEALCGLVRAGALELFYKRPSSSGGTPSSSRVPATARKGSGDSSRGKGRTSSCCSTTVPSSVTSSR